MRLLIVDIYHNMHRKNREGMEMILRHLGVEFDYAKPGTDVGDYDVVYSPMIPINTALYPRVRFIFGPQFSVFPNQLLGMVNCVHKNAVYIHPSQWALDVWAGMNVESMPMDVLRFPVDVDRFRPTDAKRTRVFVYFKRRKPEELELVTAHLKKIGQDHVVFDYVKGYKEADYLECLQAAKYGIWVGTHESQGFALQEALSCDVPLLVWNARYMSQEVGSAYGDLPVTTIPYWGEKCGEYFFDAANFLATFERFTTRVYAVERCFRYSPRGYATRELGTSACAVLFYDLIRKHFG